MIYTTKSESGDECTLLLASSSVWCLSRVVNENLFSTLSIFHACVCFYL